MLSLLLGAGPTPAARTPVLVELFTSEGCSSCPPADALLRRLVRDQPVAGARVIGLSEHVDYWDDLGWRDPYSDRAYSGRQVTYARRLGLGGAYTPQVVVDGERDALGSSAAAVLAAISELAARPKGEIEARLDPAAGTVRVEATWAGKVAADVFLALTENEAVSVVLHGENQGKTLVHASVVRSLVRLGEGAGRFQGTAAIPPASGRARSLVVFVQAKGGGQVHAIGELAVP
jgi:hypothetical protein